MELRQRSFNEERRQNYCAQHVSIANALRVRDAEGAALAMRTHLLTRRKHYFGE
jgi:DNA-binding GntR family transcriptional regulator